MNDDIKRKITSRKFWLSVAAFLGSIAASISGIATGEKWLTITGVVCGMLSAAIYAGAEAYIDAAHVDDIVLVDDVKNDK